MVSQGIACPKIVRNVDEIVAGRAWAERYKDSRFRLCNGCHKNIIK